MGCIAAGADHAVPPSAPNVVGMLLLPFSIATLSRARAYPPRTELITDKQLANELSYDLRMAATPRLTPMPSSAAIPATGPATAAAAPGPLSTPVPAPPTSRRPVCCGSASSSPDHAARRARLSLTKYALTYTMSSSTCDCVSQGPTPATAGLMRSPAPRLSRRLRLSGSTGEATTPPVFATPPARHRADLAARFATATPPADAVPRVVMVALPAQAATPPAAPAAPAAAQQLQPPGSQGNASDSDGNQAGASPLATPLPTCPRSRTGTASAPEVEPQPPEVKQPSAKARTRRQASDAAVLTIDDDDGDEPSNTGTGSSDSGNESGGSSSSEGESDASAEEARRKGGAAKGIIVLPSPDQPPPPRRKWNVTPEEPAPVQLLRRKRVGRS